MSDQRDRLLIHATIDVVVTLCELAANHSAETGQDINHKLAAAMWDRAATMFSEQRAAIVSMARSKVAVP